jgi:uncharacterized protein (TIGR03435 family)
MMKKGRVRKRNFTRLVLLTAGSLAVAGSLLGQTSGALSGAAQPDASSDVKVPVFDVVSVKPNTSESGMIRVMGRPDGYFANNVSLKMLIQGAYGIREDLISGAPSWTDSARFDIDAKVAGSDVEALKKLTPEQRRLMLQPLLADRFKLKVHTETKELPVYELVLAKGGSKLKEATPGDTYANGIKGPDGVGRGGMMRVGRGQLTAQAVPMSNLANMLSTQLHRTVLDKTGLTGKYDLELNWTPDPGAEPMFKGPDSGQHSSDTAQDSSGPTIFTALQEQLGLKLQSARGPVETIVIDHVEMPSEN